MILSQHHVQFILSVADLFPRFNVEDADEARELERIKDELESLREFRGEQLDNETKGYIVELLEETVVHLKGQGRTLKAMQLGKIIRELEGVDANA